MNIAGFGFPLNVYAALLQWTQGRVDYLHYGLFERADESIAIAQERASQRLWAQMPPPCRVLEVGIGLGTTLRRLRERGYAAHGITPDRAQIAAIIESGAQPLSIEASRLEDLGPERGPWDLMLLQESAQYIDPVALFEAAARLLDPSRASLIVMDEFALRRDGDADLGLHLLPQFVDLAQRFGWRLVHDEDVSAATSVTLDVLLALSAQHRQRLIDELGVSVAQLDALDASNRRYRACYQRAVFGYRLLRFDFGSGSERAVFVAADP